MKNEYVIQGSVTTILIPRRDGTVSQVLISTDQLERAKEFAGSWCIMTSPSGRQYAYGKIYAGQAKGVQGGGETIFLHRWLTGLTKGDKREADHVRWTTLDCRAENLRVVTHQQNAAHRQLDSRPFANNSSTGVRNVRPCGNRFVVKVAGRYLGSFATISEAKKVAAKARAEHTTAKVQAAVSGSSQLMVDRADRLRAAIMRGSAGTNPPTSLVTDRKAA